MNNRQLEIIMRLRDEVTKKLQGVEGAFLKFSAQVKNFAKELKRIGTDISHVGSSFLMLGAALTGPLALAFNSAGKYSSAVRVHDLINITSNPINAVELYNSNHHETHHATD